MRVYDGESSSSNPEPKPTSNFCDAYLTYLNSSKGKPADYTDGGAAQGSSEECGLLRIGVNGTQGSKWTFYNSRTSPLPDRRSESTPVGTHFTRGTTNCLTRHLGHRRMNLARHHHALKGLQDLRREFADKNHKKGINLKGKSSNSIDLAKTKLASVSTSTGSAEKCLKVTLKQMSLNDSSWLKLENDVFKIPKNEGNAEGNVSLAANLSRIVVSEIPSAALSEIPSTIIIARTVEKVAASKDQNFDQFNDQLVNLNEVSEETEECVRLKDSGPEISVNDLDHSIGSAEGLFDHVEMTQLQSDESRLLQEEKPSDCIELSVNEAPDVSVTSQDKLHSDSSTEQKLVGIDKQALDVQQPQGSAEVSERSKLPSRSLRSGIRHHQCGILINDSIFKNSWRKKLIKKHLVSEKFKTQASRRLNAERPKRNIGQRKNVSNSL